MFFENLETRRMLSAVASVVLVSAKLPQLAVTQVTLSKTDINGSAGESEAASLLRGTARRTAPELNLPSRTRQELGGLIELSTDPSQRTDFAGSDIRASLNEIIGAGRLGEFVRSLDLIDNVVGSVDAGTGRAGGSEFIGGALDAVRGELGTFRNGLPQKGQDPRRMSDADDNSASGTVHSEDEERGALDKIGGFFATIVDYAKEVALAKWGPPGPWTTPLTAPAVVEEVTGDSTDLVTGFRAIFGSKSRPMVPEGADETPAPDGDVKLTPQQAEALRQFWAVVGTPAGGPTLAEQGTGLISQPGSGEQQITREHSREELSNNGKRSLKDTRVTNPGSGDDGASLVSGTSGTLPKPRAVVKDPPKQDMVGELGTPPQPGRSPVNPQ